jgi:hypothetical protein
MCKYRQTDKLGEECVNMHKAAHQGAEPTAARHQYTFNTPTPAASRVFVRGARGAARPLPPAPLLTRSRGHKGAGVRLSDSPYGGGRPRGVVEW